MLWLLKHSDKRQCPAKDTTCSCGRKGHFKKFCFSGGKPRVNNKPEEKKVEGKKDESGNNFTSSLFSMKVDNKIPASSNIKLPTVGLTATYGRVRRKTRAEWTLRTQNKFSLLEDNITDTATVEVRRETFIRRTGRAAEENQI